MAVLTPVMIAGLAFGSEVGFWELSKRRLQNAADTAAFAAATQLRSGLEQDDFEKAALTVANDSGFTFALHGDLNASGHSGTLLVEAPPSTGAYAGDNDAIMVSVNTTVPRRFTKLFMSDDILLSAFATAEVRNPRPACVLALDPTANSAVHVDGSTNVTLTGCDVAANSISNTAFTQENNSAAITTECISTVGGVSIADPSNVVLTDAADCPEPKENAPVTADPYRNRPEPAVPMACASTTGGPNSEHRQLTPTNGDIGNPLPTWNSPTNNNLEKAYCIGNNEVINGTVNFAPGVYVIKGTCTSPPCTLQVNGSAVLTGEGVTLYFADNVRLVFNGNPTIDLHAPTPDDIPAPTTSDYHGLVFYFGRNNTHESVITGDTDFNIVGAIYGPRAKVTYTGSSSGSNPGECTQIIAGRVEFTGASDFDTDCSASGTTDIVTSLSIALVE